MKIEFFTLFKIVCVLLSAFIIAEGENKLRQRMQLVGVFPHFSIYKWYDRERQFQKRNTQNNHVE